MYRTDRLNSLICLSACLYTIEMVVSEYIIIVCSSVKLVRIVRKEIFNPLGPIQFSTFCNSSHLKLFVTAEYVVIILACRSLSPY